MPSFACCRPRPIPRKTYSPKTNFSFIHPEVFLVIRLVETTQKFAPIVMYLDALQTSLSNMDANCTEDHGLPTDSRSAAVATRHDTGR